MCNWVAIYSFTLIFIFWLDIRILYYLIDAKLTFVCVVLWLLICSSDLSNMQQLICLVSCKFSSQMC